MQHWIALPPHTQHRPHTAQVARDAGVSQRTAWFNLGLKRNPARVGMLQELRVNACVGTLRVLIVALSAQVQVERMSVMAVPGYSS